MTWAEAEDVAPGCSAEWDVLTSGHPVEVTNLEPGYIILLWIEGRMEDGGGHTLDVVYRYVRGWGWMRWRAKGL